MPQNSIVGTVHDETGYAIITINIASGGSPESQKFNGKKAVIDTGATNSAIDQELINELGLAQMGAHDGRAFDRIIPDVPHYAGRIEIPELSWGWDLKTIHPTNGIPEFYDAVIGNDILGSCTLVVVGLTKRFTLIRGTPIEPFSSCVCLADLQYVDGLGELSGAPGAAAELAEDVPGLELGVRALAG